MVPRIFRRLAAFILLSTLLFTVVPPVQPMAAASNNTPPAMSIADVAQTANALPITSLPALTRTVQSNATIATTTLPQVSAGWRYNCVINSAGTLTCWGDNFWGQATVPSDLGAVNQVSAGSEHTCAVTSANALRCWGDNRDGQTTVPSNLGAVSQVSAGSAHTCAVTSANALRCWGDNSFGQMTVPSDLGAVSQVSTGYYGHTCAVTSTHALRCWGDNTYGQATVPSDPLGSPTAYVISGSVRTPVGVGIADVTVAINTSLSTTTTADGTFTLAGVAPGTYTLTARKDGYTFSDLLNVAVTNANLSGQDFIATSIVTATVTPTGTVSATAMPTMTATGTVPMPTGTIPTAISTPTGTLPTATATSTVPTPTRTPILPTVTLTTVPANVDASIGQEYQLTGKELSLTITMGNNGPDDLVGVIVDNPLPEPAPGTSWAWTCTATGGADCGISLASTANQIQRGATLTQVTGTGNIKQRLGHLPMRGSVIFTVKGTLNNVQRWSNTPMLVLPSGTVNKNGLLPSAPTVGRFQVMIPLVRR